MAFLKNMEKMLSANHKLVLVGLLLLTLAIGMYSNRKSSPPVSEGMQIKNTPRSNPAGKSRLVAPPINRIREGFRQRRREGMDVMGDAGQSAQQTAQQTAQLTPQTEGNPSELLPSDSKMGPGVAMGTTSLLQAGALMGLDTVGSSMRNANLQLRSDPVIEKKVVSPFLNSTITNSGTGLDVQNNISTVASGSGQ